MIVHSILNGKTTQHGEIGVFYITKDASNLIRAGLKVPKQISNALTSSDGIVHLITEKVNMRISDVTQSPQFKEWFGDWQNDAAHASKIVKDGAPLKMYRGDMNLGNVLDFKNREEANAWYRKHIEGYDAISQKKDAAIKSIDDKMNAIESKMFQEETTDDNFQPSSA